jgi:signal peptidase I
MDPPINNPEEISAAALELLESHRGDFWTVVKGGSMLPLIKDGDRVHVHPLPGLPQRGDILVFHRADGLVAHRLLRLSAATEGENVCLTQGDNTLTPDPPLSLNHVVGRAVTLSRGEKELCLDAPAWQRLGRLVGAIQLAAVKFRAGSWMQRAVTASIGLFIRIYLLIAGL